MLKIGDFARLGQVSVRMLRHYDEVGLLVPATVDPWSGYRGYTADQLSRLNRLVALKGLGFTLRQVRDLLDASDPERLVALLRLRQEQLGAEVELARQRLADVEWRLRLIEREGTMSDYTFVTKSLPAMRLADLSAHVDDVDASGSAMEEMYGRLTAALSSSGPLSGPSVTWFEPEGEGDGVTAHASWPYAGEPRPEFDIVELPAEPLAATTTYVGPIGAVGQAWQGLARWWSEEGYEPSGPGRSLTMTEPPADPAGDWVIELQQPVRAI